MSLALRAETARRSRSVHVHGHRLLVTALDGCLVSGCGGKAATPADGGGAGVGAGGTGAAGTSGSAGTGVSSSTGVGGSAGGGGSSVGQAIFIRADYPATAPDSLAVADLDGKNGPDIAVAFPNDNAIGVLLNKGDGTMPRP